MLKIRTVPVTLFMQNARLLSDPAAGETVIVDPGGDVPALLAAIEPSTTVVAVWLTHAHLDHAGGVAELLDALERSQGRRPDLIGHKLEARMRASIADQAAMFGLPSGSFRNCPEPSVYLDHGAEVSVGSHRAKVLFTPGHSPGHIAFSFGETEVSGDASFRGPFVLAGDTLFEGSIGRTDLPGGNGPQLLESIKRELLTLPEETVVMAGHGEDTTVGREKRSNPFVGQRSPAFS